MKFTTTNRGFTLIELMVVITIIGLLASSVLVALGNARAKARDARRTADIKALMSALELYANDNASYPLLATKGEINEALFGSTGLFKLVPLFLDKLPVDPVTSQRYYYQAMSVSGNVNGYGIEMTYERSPAIVAENTACARGVNMATNATGITATVCK